jgi:hypothetical protein
MEGILMANSSHLAKVEVSSNPEEDEFWLTIGKSLISNAIKGLDSRAQFMITTSASLLTVDFAILLFTSKVTTLTISPQFFFAFSALCFIVSLFPKQYKVNPWQPDSTKLAYYKMLNVKRKYHIVGFVLFFLGLVLVGLSSFFVVL